MHNVIFTNITYWLTNSHRNGIMNINNWAQVNPSSVLIL